jgi:predicted GNAT family acetyltransferase
MEQTAVEWLVSQLNKQGFAQVVTDEEIKQAKEMEKQQIIDAYVECWKTHVPNGIEFKLPAKE